MLEAKAMNVPTTTTMPSYKVKATTVAGDKIGSYHFYTSPGPFLGLYRLAAKEGDVLGYFIKINTSEQVKVGGDTYQLTSEWKTL